MLLEAKECLGQPEAGRGKEGNFLYKLQREHRPAATLILEF